MTYPEIESHLVQSLGLATRPVAVTFTDAPPAGVPRFEGQVPSGCTFWQLAGEGRAFFTSHADHYNCPIGCYTHNIPLPPEREQELMGTLGLMADIGYIRMDEVPGIPRVARTAAHVVYAPLAQATGAPDVVIVRGPAGKLMLLQEAAYRAGVKAQAPLLARPTCMAVPAALEHGVTASTGCIGNRVYTQLGDGDLYVAIPGADVARVTAQLQTILSANATLQQYHEQRRSELLQVKA